MQLNTSSKNLPGELALHFNNNKKKKTGDVKEKKSLNSSGGKKIINWKRIQSNIHYITHLESLQ
jgi:hypothetical protein